jgi:GDP-4-dehydro-6-deoxy-D-mannose reductase
VRVFVTGAGGFVGRWLCRELESAGHEVVGRRRSGGPRLEIRDAEAVRQAVVDAQPDALVHLAAVASAADVAERPDEAFAVTVGGTVNVMEAVRDLARLPHVLVVGSSEVYGDPTPEDLPLEEAAPLRPRKPYALSKVAQESVALAYAARLELSLAVVRPFNHTGPGQRPAFVVPAMARRVLAVRDGRATDIPVGNVDVSRDFTDVRDVTRAYRLLLESLSDGRAGKGGLVLNVASGRSVAIRRLVELLAEAAGVEPVLRTDPSLVRQGDPVDVRGDASALRRLTGWRPETPLADTLRDVFDDIASSTATQHLS